MNKKQKEVFNKIRKAVLAHRRGEIDSETPVTFINDFAAGDKKFLTTLATELNLMVAWDEFNDQDQNVVSLYFPPPPQPARTPPENENGDEGEWVDTSEDEAAIQESNFAVDRVLNRYKQAKTLEEGDDEFDKREAERLKEKMDEWKTTYYRVGS